MEKYILVIIAGIVGGLLAQRFHIPGGAVVGSMLFAGCVAVLFKDGISLPPAATTGVQILLGISLGMTFDRSFLHLNALALPLAILSTVILLAVAVLMAFTASRLGLMDFGTALFGFSPGGMSGMAILAETEGHKTNIVAFCHLIRVFTLFLIVPLLVRIVVYLQQRV